MLINQSHLRIRCFDHSSNVNLCNSQKNCVEPDHEREKESEMKRESDEGDMTFVSNDFT